MEKITEKDYQTALSSKPTFDGSKTSHVWKDSPLSCYKCSCCQKIYWLDGSPVYRIPEGLEDLDNTDLTIIGQGFAEVGVGVLGGIGGFLMADTIVGAPIGLALIIASPEAITGGIATIRRGLGHTDKSSERKLLDDLGLTVIEEWYGW